MRRFNDGFVFRTTLGEIVTFKLSKLVHNKVRGGEYISEFWCLKETSRWKPLSISSHSKLPVQGIGEKEIMVRIKRRKRHIKNNFQDIL